jgi:hypothetical protein
MFTNCKIVKAGANQVEYRAQNCKRGDAGYIVSRSDLTDIRRCPHKWRYADTTSDNGSKSTEWGNLIDALLLCNGDNIAVTPETYESSDGKIKPWNWNANTCKAWRTENIGKIITNPSDKRLAEYAVSMIKNDSTIAPVLDKASCQVWIAGEWRADGLAIPVRALVDIVPKHIPVLVDLKTTKSASLRDFARSIYFYGYHVQAAMYLDMWNAAVPDDKRTGFYHIVQENEYPYETAKRRLDNNWIQLGRAEYKKALEIYAQCLKSGNWPSYDEIDGQNLMVIDGWTSTSPEPWMILHAGIEIDDNENLPEWAQ